MYVVMELVQRWVEWGERGLVPRGEWVSIDNIQQSYLLLSARSASSFILGVLWFHYRLKQAL